MAVRNGRRRSGRPTTIDPLHVTYDPWNFLFFHAKQLLRMFSPLSRREGFYGPCGGTTCLAKRSASVMLGAFRLRDWSWP